MQHCLLCLAAVTVLVLLCVSVEAVPQPRKLRFSQKGGDQQQKGTDATKSRGYGKLTDQKIAALFADSPDLVVPKLLVDFKVGVPATEALGIVEKAVTTAGKKDQHYLVAAEFSAAEVEAYTTKMAKLEAEEAKLAKNLVSVFANKGSTTVPETLKDITAASADEIVGVLKHIQKDLFFADKKKEDYAATVVYSVRLDVKKAPTAEGLPALTEAIKAVEAAVKSASQVRAVHIITEAADPAFPCPKPGAGNTPCDPARYNDVPDLKAWQTYLTRADGMGWDDIDTSIPGADAEGHGIRVFDIESGYDIAHINLKAITRAVKATGLPDNTHHKASHHGTSVLTMLLGNGKSTGKGVHGMIPAADPYFSSRYYSANGVNGWTVNPVHAMQRVNHLNPAHYDVVLLELQQNGHPNTCGLGYAGQGGPVEVYPGMKAAVAHALAAGAVVVAAGGNDGVDLDNVACNYFSNVNDDTIYVGSVSAATPHAVRADSLHGKRVDIHANGDNLAAGGYGDDVAATAFQANGQATPKPGSANRDYTWDFGGTSGASPQVTSTVVMMSSILKKYQLKVPAGTFQRLLRANAQPLASAANGAGGYLNASKTIKATYDFARECRFCQYALAEAASFDHTAAFQPKDIIDRTCLALSNKKEHELCVDFLKTKVFPALFSAFKVSGQPASSAKVPSIMRSVILGANAGVVNDAGILAATNAVCSVATGYVCNLELAHHTTWKTAYAATPFLSNVLTRNQVQQ